MDQIQMAYKRLPMTLEERFEEFHDKNPHVYVALVKLARQLMARGHKKIGIAMLWEVLRWQSMLQTEGDPFKLNNDYKSRYARLIMAIEPDLEGVFDLRELKA